MKGAVNLPHKANLPTSDRELLFLSWPIFVELLMGVIIGNINVWMISHFNELAVASISATNQLIGLSVNIYGFITIGAQITIAQFLGANRNKELPTIINTALFGGLGIGLALSLLFFSFPKQLLAFMNLPPNIISLGTDYARIYGGGLFIAALNAVMIATLRTHGYTRQALIIPMAASLFTVCGNFVALFSPFGLPNLGVRGLACSALLGNLIAFGLASQLLKKYIHFDLLSARPRLISAKMLKQILKLGLPSSGESVSYQGAQVVVTMIVASLGANVLITKSYVASITQFVFLTAAALSQGNQIIIGRNVGAKNFSQAYQRGLRSTWQNVLISTSICLATFCFIEPIMHIFTHNPAIISLARWVFLVEILLEAARAVNMTLVGSLNASGDVKFPLICSLTVLWLISLPFSYLLAIGLKLGLVGVWLAYTIDESLRACLMIHRWRKGQWRQKVIID
nr:MATE family efflux transporter [Ligilactobacillus agilis]